MENHIRGVLKTFGIKLGTVTAAGFTAKVKAAVAEKDGLVRDIMFCLLTARDGVLGATEGTRQAVRVHLQGRCRVQTANDNSRRWRDYGLDLQGGNRRSLTFPKVP